MNEEVNKNIKNILDYYRTPEEREKENRIIDITQPVIDKLFLEDAITCATGYKAIGAFKEVDSDDLVNFILAFIGMELTQGKLILKETDKKEQKDA